MTPTAHRLWERLTQVCALEPCENPDLSPSYIADAIKAAQVDWAVCDRAATDGKSLSFQHFFEAVYKVGLDLKPLKAARRKGAA